MAGKKPRNINGANANLLFSCLFRSKTTALTSPPKIHEIVNELSQDSTLEDHIESAMKSFRSPAPIFSAKRRRSRIAKRVAKQITTKLTLLPAIMKVALLETKNFMRD